MKIGRFLSAVLASVLVSSPVIAHAVDSPNYALPGTTADYVGTWSHDTGSCSIVVIDQNYALTAAHCADEKSSKHPYYNHVRSGADRGHDIRFEWVLPHDTADIAIMKISSNTPLPTAQLPSQSIPEIGQRGHAIGWGARYDNTTSAYVDAQFTHFQKNEHGDVIMDITTSDTGRVVQGDSGGAFMVDETVIGITSHVYLDEDEGSLPRYQAVPVSSYMEWISAVTGLFPETEEGYRTILDSFKESPKIDNSKTMEDTWIPIRQRREEQNDIDRVVPVDNKKHFSLSKRISREIGITQD